jgi:hypothetical protein
MSHLTVRHLAAPALILGATIAAGCGSDSSTGPAPRTLAVHFDSLWQQAVVANDTLRQYVMFRIAVPLAFGVAPKEVSITVDGSTTKWNAVSYEYISINSAGAAIDSVYHFSAWADANANNTLVTDYYPARGQFGMAYLNGGTEETGVSGTIADTVISASGTCSALDLASVYSDAEYSTCSQSQQASSFDVNLGPFRSLSSPGPTASEIKLGSVRLPAVRLFEHL